MRVDAADEHAVHLAQICALRKRYLVGFLGAAFFVLLGIFFYGRSFAQTQRAHQLAQAGYAASQVAETLNQINSRSRAHVLGMQNVLQAAYESRLTHAPEPFRRLDLLSAQAGTSAKAWTPTDALGEADRRMSGSLFCTSAFLAAARQTPEAASELSAHLALGPDLIQAHREGSPFQWSYTYDAEGRFSLLFPWLPGKELLASTQTLDMDQALRVVLEAGGTFPLQAAGPARNPSRDLVWTEPYLDAGGKGLMVSLLAPVYQRDTLRAVVGADLTLSYLQKALQDLPSRNTRILILDAQKRIVADTAVTAHGQTQWKKLQDPLPPWLDHALKSGSKPARADFRPEGHAYWRLDPLAGTPWHVVTRLEAHGLEQEVSAIMRNYYVLSATMILLGAVFWYALHRNYAMPALKLVKHIAELSSGADPQCPPVPPIWRAWFSTLDKTARERRAYLLELQDNTRTLEHAVAERTEQLTVANAQALIAKAKAEEASRAKSLFLASMSHELRTPLNTILLYSELLIDETRERDLPTLEADLNRIQLSGRHLLSLIDDILDLSKIEAGRMTVVLEDFFLDDLFRDITATIEPLAARNQNTFAVRNTTPIASLYSDQKKIRQILYNLLSNAAKFTEHGTITLAVEIDPDPGFVQFQVHDTGIGMTEAQVDKVFLDFTQAEETTSHRFGGTGLGLSLSRRFAEMLGGSLWAESRMGEGSTFFVKLPRRAMSPTAAPPDAEAEELPVRRGTVLTVDDDPAVREAISRMLAKEGFQVAMAASAREGMEMAKTIRPSIITLDILMQGADGWSLLTDLKADPDLREIPVILVSVLEGRDRGFALGASAVLQKPIDRSDLIRTIRRCCLPAQGGPPVLLVEDDPATRNGVQRILESEGYGVACAANGHEALAWLDQDRPALILLDLMMPRMDGFQFMAELVKHDSWLDIPVIVLTAMRLSAQDLEHLRAPQVRSILEKGVLTKDDLIRTVRTFALRFTEPQGPPPS